MTKEKGNRRTISQPVVSKTSSFGSLVPQNQNKNSEPEDNALGSITRSNDIILEKKSKQKEKGYAPKLVMCYV